MAFSIKTEVFEGPLDLLLSLIEKRKLLINDISLARVADDFVGYTQNMQSFPVADTVDFILIASTLLLIKSKSLLPTLELTDEEKSDVHDLELRLKIYQRMKELSLHVKTRYAEKPIYFPNPQPVMAVFAPSVKTNITQLHTMVRGLIHALPKLAEKLPQAVVKKVISLEEMITNLTKRIQTSLKMSFKDFSGMGKQEKVHVIVSFLAMLELVKEGVVHVSQDRQFDDIHMETRAVGVPNYN
ncbi:MAG: segregation/condensation protein A [Candidatus Paceibacterota bacterium]